MFPASQGIIIGLGMESGPVPVKIAVAHAPGAELQLISP